MAVNFKFRNPLKWFFDRRGANTASLGVPVATRATSADSFAFMGMLPNPDPVLRARGANVSEYRKLLSDPFLKGIIKNRRGGVLRMLWGLDRGQTKSRQAKAIEAAFKRLEINR